MLAISDSLPINSKHGLLLECLYLCLLRGYIDLQHLASEVKTTYLDYTDADCGQRKQLCFLKN